MSLIFLPVVLFHYGLDMFPLSTAANVILTAGKQFRLLWSMRRPFSRTTELTETNTPTAEHHIWLGNLIWYFFVFFGVRGFVVERDTDVLPPVDSDDAH